MKKMQNLAMSDNEKKIDKMTVLIGENARLKQLYQEAATYKNKFMKKNTQLTKDLKKTKFDLEQAWSQVDGLKKRLKKVNFSKKTFGTVYEEKIQGLTEEVEMLVERNQDLKKKLKKEQKECLEVQYNPQRNTLALSLRHQALLHHLIRLLLTQLYHIKYIHY